MNKNWLVTVICVLVFIGTFVFAFLTPGSLEAKPNMCVLTIEPFYYCIESNSCKGPGEMKCWECHGWDLYGEPCLCARIGCMVPPQ